MRERMDPPFYAEAVYWSCLDYLHLNNHLDLSQSITDDALRNMEHALFT